MTLHIFRAPSLRPPVVEMRPAFQDGPCGCEGETAAVAHLRAVLLNVPLEGLSFYQQERVREARNFLRDHEDAVRGYRENGGGR